MYLFDTSIWIDFLKDTRTQQVELLTKSLPEYNVIICPTIFQEILQGIRSQEQYDKIYFLLNIATQKLIEDSYSVSIGAANIYRTLRVKGITVRKPNDCIIAWHCLQNGLKLVHNDKDFDLIAEHFPLDCWSYL